MQLTIDHCVIEKYTFFFKYTIFMLQLSFPTRNIVRYYLHNCLETCRVKFNLITYSIEDFYVYIKHSRTLIQMKNLSINISCYALVFFLSRNIQNWIFTVFKLSKDLRLSLTLVLCVPLYCAIILFFQGCRVPEIKSQNNLIFNLGILGSTKKNALRKEK